MSDTPNCPNCGSAGVTTIVQPQGTLRYDWECGAWAWQQTFMLHGAESVVDYDSCCDLIATLRAEVVEAKRQRVSDQLECEVAMDVQANEVSRLRAEIAAMKPVVEAAVAWFINWRNPQENMQELRSNMFGAVEDYREAST